MYGKNALIKFQRLVESLKGICELEVNIVLKNHEQMR